MAGFLIIVGLTGSLLAFYSELDRAINPKLYPAIREAARLDIAALADRAAVLANDATVTTVYLREAERAEVRISGVEHADTLLIDPYTGAELARYTWGDIGQGRINIMPFIYRLHFELALGDVGLWTLGIIALIWTLDCFVGFYLTLPAHRKSSNHKSWWRRWRPSWRVKHSAGVARFNFDLHRASGLWLWPVLLVFAWSSVYMNLYDTVYTWTTRALFEYHPAWTEIPPQTVKPPTQRLSWHDALHAAESLLQQEAEKRNIKIIAPVSLRYSEEQNVFSYRVRTDRDIQTRRGITELDFDAHSGELRLLLLPTGQYTGNTITNWLYALHMANAFGFFWKIVVCVMGLAITMLSATGVYIWFKKWRARSISKQRRAYAAGVAKN